MPVGVGNPAGRLGVFDGKVGRFGPQVVQVVLGVAYVLELTERIEGFESGRDPLVGDLLHAADDPFGGRHDPIEVRVEIAGRFGGAAHGPVGGTDREEVVVEDRFEDFGFDTEVVGAAA